MPFSAEHDIVAQKVLEESAVDVEDEHVAPLANPFLKTVAAGDGMRRRASDFGRSRPTNLTAEMELGPVGPTEGSPSAAAKSVDDSAPDVELASATSVTRSTTAHLAPRDDLPQTLTAIQRRWRLIHFVTLCYTFFLAGWNDSSTGPLLPTIQRHYGIGFAIVSLLFVTNVIGYLIGAVANVYLTDKHGFGKILALGSTSQLTGYAISSSGGPFALMCVGYGFTGFGLALEITQGNSYVGSLKEGASTKLGIMHASYGLGALSAPLIATQFAVSVHWSFHYLVSASLAVVNIIALCAVFRFKPIEAIREESGEGPSEQNTTIAESKYKQIFKIPAVHYLAFWTLIYVGVEVTLGGWIVTFIQQKRDGGASAGYISSGFFGGLMAGRILLMWLNQKIGEHRVIFLYAVLAIGLEVTIWAIPSLIQNAIAVSFIGLLLGPMYPILVHHASLILPKWLYAGAIGWVSGIGQAGSAVLPFLTGVLASRFGISSLQPFIVSMMSTLIVLWALVPRVRRID